MSAWESTFDLQTELWNFYNSPLGISFARSFRESMLMNGTYPYELDSGEPAYLEDLERGRLYRAEPIYVAPEMHELIKVAAESFELEPLLPHDVFTNHGFVVFPEAFMAQDKSFRTITWRAALWDTTMVRYADGLKPALLISLYSDRRDYEIEEDLKHLREFPTQLVLLHFAPWNFNDTITNLEERGKVPLRQLQAFFRIAQQTITTKKEEPISRASRRRSERVKMRPRPVTVIRLRRPKSKPDDPLSAFHYDHRWVVRGHWRNQWFPSLETHRQIWISDYIKGPEDKPLRITERRAFELVQ